jgi:hypothetical protein
MFKRIGRYKPSAATRYSGKTRIVQGFAGALLFLTRRTRLVSLS